MSPTPPRPCAAVLERAFARDQAQEVLGDLHEEFLAVAARRGLSQARAWYAVQALRLALGELSRRTARRLRG